MLLSNFLTNYQAQTRAALLPGIRFVHTVKRLKYMLHLLRRHTLSAILHAQIRHGRSALLFGPPAGSNVDCLMRLTVFNGIVNQVNDQLPQPVPLPLHH